MFRRWLRKRKEFEAAVTSEVERLLEAHDRPHAYRIAAAIASERGQDRKRLQFTIAVRIEVARRLGIRRGYDNATRRLCGD
jgi:hypothetical protein